MTIIDINQMYIEMKSTMQNNFQGTPNERYNKAKRLFLKNVNYIIEENNNDLIKEMENN